MRQPRELPDLSPDQVIRLQDALLANSDALFTSALTLLEAGRVALAQSLAILGLEEAGKAVAIHERRVQMCAIEEGAAFRCEWLDAIWSSHQRKLEIAYDFLVREEYWFGTEPSDPESNAELLGAIRRWTKKHDALKKAGLYVEFSRGGEPLSPDRYRDPEKLMEALRRVHQIGWQLRLGEHIEGRKQDDRERGLPPMTQDEVDTLFPPQADWASAELREFSLRGRPGEDLPNAAYRFNQPDSGGNPFRNVGKPGYEAETRELRRLMDEESPPPGEGREPR